MRGGAATLVHLLPTGLVVRVVWPIFAGILSPPFPNLPILSGD